MAEQMKASQAGMLGTEVKGKDRNGALIGGVIMIAIGLVILVANLTEWETLGLLIVPMLGIIFLAWGILAREAGPIIPGGILSGIGAGILLIAGPFAGTFSEDVEGGVFMLAFAAGWFLIILLTALLTEETHWWAAIPGGIMLIIGLAAIGGGIFASTLELLGYIWPLALIIGGGVLVWQWMRRPAGQ